MRTKRNFLFIALFVLISMAFISCMTPAAYSGSESAATIAVNGLGVVEASPDAAKLNLSITELRDTTSEAQSAVNKKVASAIETALAAGISEDQIHTSSISFNAEYDWTDDGRVLRGQRVRQTLTLTLTGIDEDPDLVAAVFDGLGKISGIEVSSLSFYVEDTMSLYQEARELAFTKAQQKAEEYAALGGVKLGMPISISEYSGDNEVSRNYAKGMMAEAAVADYSPSQVPTGSYSVSISVAVEFEIN